MRTECGSAARNAGVVARRAPRRSNTHRTATVVGVERLAIVVASGRNADPPCHLARRFNETAEEIAIGEIETVIAHCSYRQHTVGSGKLRSSLQKDVVCVVARL